MIAKLLRTGCLIACFFSLSLGILLLPESVKAAVKISSATPNTIVLQTGKPATLTVKGTGLKGLRSGNLYRDKAGKQKAGSLTVRYAGGIAGGKLTLTLVGRAKPGRYYIHLTDSQNNPTVLPVKATVVAQKAVTKIVKPATAATRLASPEVAKQPLRQTNDVNTAGNSPVKAIPRVTMPPLKSVSATPLKVTSVTPQTLQLQPGKSVTLTVQGSGLNGIKRGALYLDSQGKRRAGNVSVRYAGSASSGRLTLKVIGRLKPGNKYYIQLADGRGKLVMLPVKVTMHTVRAKQPVVKPERAKQISDIKKAPVAVRSKPAVSGTLEVATKITTGTVSQEEIQGRQTVPSLTAFNIGSDNQPLLQQHTAVSAEIESAEQVANIINVQNRVTISIPCGGPAKTLDFDEVTPNYDGNYYFEIDEPVVVTYEPGRNIEFDVCASTGWGSYKWSNHPTINNDTNKRATVIYSSSRELLEQIEQGRKKGIIALQVQSGSGNEIIEKKIFVTMSFNLVGVYPPAPEITEMWIDDYRPGFGGKILKDLGIVDSSSLQNPDYTDGVFYLKGNYLGGVNRVSVGGAGSDRTDVTILEQTPSLIKAKGNVNVNNRVIEVADDLGMYYYGSQSSPFKFKRLAYWVLNSDWADGVLSDFNLTIGNPIGNASFSLFGQSSSFDIAAYEAPGGVMHLNINDMNSNRPTITAVTLAPKLMRFDITIPFESSGYELIGTAFGRDATGQLSSPELTIMLYVKVNDDGTLSSAQSPIISFDSDISLNVSGVGISLSLVKGWVLNEINQNLNGQIDKEAIANSFINGLETLLHTLSGADHVRGIYPLTDGRLFFDLKL